LKLLINGDAIPTTDSIAPKSGLEPTGFALKLPFKSTFGTIVVSIPIPIAGLDFDKLKSLLLTFENLGLNPLKFLRDFVIL